MLTRQSSGTRNSWLGFAPLHILANYYLAPYWGVSLHGSLINLSTLLGVFLLILPLIFFDFYSNREFNLTISDNLNKWKVGKYFGIILVFIYIIYLLRYGHSYVVMDPHETSTYFEDWFNYYIYPGLCLAAVIYSKPVGYFFSDNSSGYGSSIKEDISFLLGNLCLVMFTWGVFVESL